MELNDKVGEADTKVCSFPLAVMRFFGKKESETMIQFNNELKALTAEDRADLKQMLTEAGWTITT